MTARRRIDFEEVKRDVMVLLYARFMADMSGCNLHLMASETGWPRNFIKLVMSSLKSEYLCREDYDGPKDQSIGMLGDVLSGALRPYVKQEDRIIEIAKSGIEWVNGLDDSLYQDSVSRIEGAALTPIAQIPASDRTVTLSHN